MKHTVMTRNRNPLIIHVPIKLCHKAGRKLIIMPDHAQQLATEPDMDDTLIKALLRAQRWQDMLSAGKSGSAADLARKESVNKSYLARVLRLTLLAPDIKQSILDGRQPRTLRLMDVLKPFPLLWDEQRKWFGII